MFQLPSGAAGLSPREQQPQDGGEAAGVEPQLLRVVTCGWSQHKRELCLSEGLAGSIWELRDP